MCIEAVTSTRRWMTFTAVAILLVAWQSVSSASRSNAATVSLVSPTTLGPNGVESAAIIAENRRTGTSSWKISNRVSPNVIQGFANLTYAHVGQNVNLYVTTRTTSYRVVAYRMGWYQGLGARRIWASPIEAGIAQPPCALDSSTNMVSCDNWQSSLVMHVSSKFVPGDYLIKLIAGPAAASYVLLTVWDPSSTAAYVVMNRSLVEQGWNTYGGYSFYKGLGGCIIDQVSYPVCNRARVVSFDRPYSSGSGSSDFLTNEYPLVQFMEKEGLDVTYISDVTLSQYPGLLVRHRTLLSLDHDESWTYAERVAVEKATARGVNDVYFGAAAMVRHVRLQPSPLGANREEVDYRSSSEDPLNGVGSATQVTGNTWESPPADWSPIGQIGVEYSGYLSPGASAPMVISDASSWVFAGTGLHNGSSIPGVIASDFDHVIGTSPANVEILAHSPIPLAEATASGATFGGYSYSDMVYFTNPRSQAGVIDTGNNVWISDLRPCIIDVLCAAPTITKITNNILHVFGQAPAGTLAPDVNGTTSGVPASS